MALFENVFIVYVVFGTVLAFLMWRRDGSEEDFFLAGRKLGGVLSALTYAATTYSAFMMVGLVGLSYATGVGALGFELTYLVSTVVLLSCYSRKVWEISKERGIISPYELFRSRNARIFASLLSLLALIPYTSVQLVGSALVLDKYSELDYTSSSLVIALVAFSWALIAGLRSVAVTDALQGIIMLFSAVGIVIFSFLAFGNGLQSIGEESTVPNDFWTPVTFLTMTLPWMFFAITNPQVFQRVFVLRDESAFKKMILLFAVFGFLFTVLTVVLGLNLRGLATEGVFPRVSDRDRVTLTVLSFAPEWLAVLVSMSVIMAAVTTMNSILLTLASVVSRNVCGNLLIDRAILFILSALVFVFSVLRPGYVVELAVLSSTALLPTLIPILGEIHGKGGSATASLIGGTLAFILGKLILLPVLPLWVIAFSALFYFLPNVYKHRHS